ncbi:methionyl-tRNA formyltransferase, partial [bacterium]|nr:methionyl-tRNA formyltransferase [bacterium]
IVAHRLGIPVLQPVTTKSDIFLEEMRSFHPDLLVVVAYGEILRPTLLNLPPYGAVNLHASLLPKYRGAAPIPWAILQGESHTGATTMLINEVMDGGDILLQQECPILPADTGDTLTKKLANLGAPLLRRTADLLQRNEITPKPQDLAQVTYAPKLRKEDGRIDWTKTASWISRQFRAFDAWPGSFSYFRDLRVKFWLAHATEGETTSLPGTVIAVQKHSFQIACGEGTILEVLEIQPENRPRFPAADFIHGYSIHPQDRFLSSAVP